MNLTRKQDALDAAEPQPAHAWADWCIMLAGGGIVVLVLWIIGA